MRIRLAKILHSSSGFTLIELLVVIAIIAILAVIGFASFQGLTTRGNDARRQSDIKAIADAFEVKRGTASDYGGLQLALTDFASGSIPTDPVTTKAYCMRTNTVAITNAVVSTTDGIDSTGCHGSNWVAVTGTFPAGRTFFKVCSLAQNNTTVFCVGSKQ